MAARSQLALLGVALLLGCAPAVEDGGSADPRLASDRPYGVPAAGARGPLAATGFNAFIMGAAANFGTAAYEWSGDGVTRDILYKGTLIATPYAPDKCHCVGATFQVYMTAFEAWDKQYNGSSGDLRGLTVDQVKQLKQQWYVATSDESGSQGALTSNGLGAKVTDWAQAQQGDPVQIWRNNDSGHSVIFDSWVYQGGKVTGITYFSCQSSGAGFNTETIGAGPTDVTASRIYIVHPRAPSDPPPDLGAPDLGQQADATGTTDLRVPPGDGLPPVAMDGGSRPRPEEGCGCTVDRRPGPQAMTLLSLGVLAGLLLCRRFGG